MSTTAAKHAWSDIWGLLDATGIWNCFLNMLCLWRQQTTFLGSWSRWFPTTSRHSFLEDLIWGWHTNWSYDGWFLDHTWIPVESGIIMIGIVINIWHFTWKLYKHKINKMSNPYLLTISWDVVWLVEAMSCITWWKMASSWQTYLLLIQ